VSVVKLLAYAVDEVDGQHAGDYNDQQGNDEAQAQPVDVEPGALGFPIRSTAAMGENSIKMAACWHLFISLTSFQTIPRHRTQSRIAAGWTWTTRRAT